MRRQISSGRPACKSRTREMHLRAHVEIPSDSEHLESDRDTHPKVSEAVAINMSPSGPGPYEPRTRLAALNKQAHRMCYSQFGSQQFPAQDLFQGPGGPTFS